MSEALEVYMDRVNRIRVLTAEQEKDLCRKYADGDKDAGDKLIEANLRFVVKAAYKLAGYGLPVEDLIQEGNMGLMRALETFNLDRGVRFLTYAQWWVQQRISRYILNQLPIAKNCRAPFRRMFFGVRAKLAMYPAEEVARQYGVSVDDVFEAAEAFKPPAELTSPLPDRGPSPEKKAFDSILSHEIRSAMQSVVKNQKEQAVVNRRLLSQAPESLREIGTSFGLSRERVRQIESALIKRVTPLLEKYRDELNA